MYVILYESCFDNICAEIAACLRVLASTFAFVTLHYLDFSTLHSCRPGCFPSVEKLSGSVKYCLDFEHLQNDTSKGCAWYCGARLS